MRAHVAAGRASKRWAGSTERAAAVVRHRRPAADRYFRMYAHVARDADTHTLSDVRLGVMEIALVAGAVVLLFWTASLEAARGHRLPEVGLPLAGTFVTARSSHTVSP